MNGGCFSQRSSLASNEIEQADDRNRSDHAKEGQRFHDCIVFVWEDDGFEFPDWEAAIFIPENVMQDDLKYVAAFVMLLYLVWIIRNNRDLFK